MQHSFTDQQIDTAKHLSARRMSRDWISRFNVKDIRAFLDALPEPDDGWQECSTGDLLMTDRFKVEGPGWTFEGEVKQLGATIVCYDPRNGNPIYTNTFDADDDLALYRIPGVQHPDPKAHAVIIVSGAYNLEWDHAYAYVSDGAGYNIVEPLNSDSRLLPEAIHNWTPAKVVADDDR